MKCHAHMDAEAVDKCTICGEMICKDCRLDFDGKAVCKSCAIPLSKVFASICSGSAGALESRVKITDNKEPKK
jgi:hypothetical protein